MLSWCSSYNWRFEETKTGIFFIVKFTISSLQVPKSKEKHNKKKIIKAKIMPKRFKTATIPSKNVSIMTFLFIPSAQPTVQTVPKYPSSHPANV